MLKIPCEKCKKHPAISFSVLRPRYWPGSSKDTPTYGPWFLTCICTKNQELFYSMIMDWLTPSFHLNPIVIAEYFDHCLSRWDSPQSFIKCFCRFICNLYPQEEYNLKKLIERDFRNENVDRHDHLIISRLVSCLNTTNLSNIEKNKILTSARKKIGVIDSTIIKEMTNFAYPWGEEKIKVL